MVTQTGVFDQRLAALDRYSTNRVLWASMLDAMQQASPDQVKFKVLATHQNYSLVPTNAFVTTNISVDWEPPTPGWKVWAGPAKTVNYLALATNKLSSITNGGAFLTNKIPYKVSMAIAATNLQNNTVTVKATFTLPWVSLEDADVVITGREYGNPPTGAGIDQFVQKVTALPYFQDWLTPGVNAFNYINRDPPTNPKADPMEPAGGPFLNFQVQFNYKKRPLLNE
jgi:hypothetical protein